VLNFDAAVGDGLSSGILKEQIGFVIFYAQLLPQTGGANLKGFLGNGQYIFRLSKDIHYVDFFGNVEQTGVTSLTQNFFCWILTTACISGVDRNDFVAMLLHVLGRKKTGAVPLGREAHYGYGLGRFKNVPQLLNIVVHTELK
jgi:hypothetical protein